MIEHPLFLAPMECKPNLNDYTAPSQVGLDFTLNEGNRGFPFVHLRQVVERREFFAFDAD